MDMNTLQDALIRDLAALFKDFKLHSSINEESSLRIYRQFIPIRVGEDEDPEAYVPPEPYIQVKLADGELNDRDERQTANVVLMIGVCDHDPNRQGYKAADGKVYRCKQDNCVHDADALPSAWEEV